VRTPSDFLQSFREGKMPEDSKFSVLCLAETALGEGDEQSLEALSSELTPAQASILAITEARVSQSDVLPMIELSLSICSSRDTRDLELEGRARMERGLERFISGNIEGASEDLSWAETRLKSVAKAGRNHDLALLNKASFHLSTNEPMMALHTYGEISIADDHAAETFVFSRLGASRILASMQQFKDAARNAWNAISHADTCGIVELQWQSMALFLGLSAQEMGEDVMSMSKTIQDVDEIFNRCLELRPTLDGPDRPDLRGLLLAATALDRVEELDWIEVESIDDPLLASGFFTATGSDRWQQRFKELTGLN
jgi:hypothetical protein